MNIHEFIWDYFCHLLVEENLFLPLKKSGQRSRYVFYHQLIIIFNLPRSVPPKIQLNAEDLSRIDRIFVFFHQHFVLLQQGNPKIRVIGSR